MNWRIWNKKENHKEAIRVEGQAPVYIQDSNGTFYVNSHEIIHSEKFKDQSEALLRKFRKKTSAK